MSGDASVPRGDVSVGLRQLILGGVLVLMAALLVLGAFWLAVSDQAVSLPRATAVAGISPEPTVALPTLPSALTPSPVLTPAPGLTPTQPLPTPTFPSLLYPGCPPPEGWLPYWVESGDSIYELALRTGTSVYVLREGNCMEAEEVQPGRIIYLPPSFFITPTPVPITCGPPPDWVKYIIRPEDTLWNLSRRLGVSVEEIQQANCMTTTRLRVGQPIYLPAVPPTLTPTPSRTPTVTPTSTPTRTPTPTPSATTTFTPTHTPTASPTFTPSPTGTVTPTFTPTFTPTPTPTATGTPTLIPTSAPTPTLTPGPTSTFTPAPTATTAPSPTATP